MRQMSLALSLAGLSFMMTVIWGAPLLRILRHFKIGKIIRVDEPGFHQVKMGTPTMGGVLLFCPLLSLLSCSTPSTLLVCKRSGVPFLSRFWLCSLMEYSAY